MQSVPHVDVEKDSRLRDSSALKCMFMAQRQRRGAERSAPRICRSSCAFSRSSCVTRASSAAGCSRETDEPRAEDEAREPAASSRALPDPVSHRGLQRRDGERQC